MYSENGVSPLRLQSRSGEGYLLAIIWWVSSLVMMAGTVSAADLGPQTLRMMDLAGRIHAIGETQGTRATAIVFLSTECPIARAYIPELNRIHESFAGKGVEFYGVFSDLSTSRAECVDFAREFEIAFPVLFDGSGEMQSRLEPTHVPEAFVLDGGKRLVYRGRIDDLYRELGRRQQTPTTRDLHEAIESLVGSTSKSGTPDLVRTVPVGCLVEQNSTSRVPVTFRRDIAPLMYANCTECHRAGEVAPFPLSTYEDCAKRSAFLAKVTKSGLMPPWMAVAGHGEFVGNRVLSASQQRLIQQWIDDGLAVGDRADEPAPPIYSKGWRLGEPDLVIESPHEFTLAADGDDTFQHYVVPIELPEDKTLIGFEFQPGNPAIVHHAVVFYDTMGSARKKDAKTPEPGYQTFGSPGIPVAGVVGFWAPGMTPRFLPDDIGYRIPKTVDFLLQLHLHPSGKLEKDRSRIGLYFAKNGAERPRMMSRVPLVLGTLMIDVPAGESSHVLRSEMTLPESVTLLSVLPHMHLIGKEMKVTAYPPSGPAIPLLWIKEWNFYWQDNYVYREPVTLPAGTRVLIEGVYDNSDANPQNPSHPPKRVLFGNDSDEEMFLAVFQTVGNSVEAEKAIATALVKGFQSDWQRPSVKPDARPRIITEAIEFLGGGEVLLKMLLNPKQSPITANGG